ncbi:intermembrane phospholipid transport protein YdbH family protein [Oceanospirillum maris]|uniref:intermembrane phospholipid transport protein YdbH family protein n=1 Tax=Oceanospirillum maris TaxID=64977 RepID=UPI000413268C|nr:YdbH domain-containing protein [Oceanospirillum maris]
MIILRRTLITILALLLVGTVLIYGLAVSHSRWLPAAVNQTILAESIAGLPAGSLQVSTIRFEHWQRLGSLEITGPTNSQLQVEGISWPQTGHLVIDRLNLRLPETLPRRKPSSQKPSLVPASTPSLVETKTLSRSAPSQQAMGFSIRESYQQLYNTVAPLLTQLDQLSEQSQLNSLTIKQLSLQGLPLDFAVNIEREPRDTLSKGRWMIRLSGEEMMPPNGGQAKRQPLQLGLNLDLATGLSSGSGLQYQAQLSLGSLDHRELLEDWVQAEWPLPVWTGVKDGLDQLQQISKQYGLSSTKTNLKLAATFTPEQADITLNLPAFGVQPVDGCPLQLEAQTLNLSYFIGRSSSKDDQTDQERLDLAMPQGQKLALKGQCLSAIVTSIPAVWAKAPSLEEQKEGFNLKGLEPASWQQGGLLTLAFEEPVIFLPEPKAPQLDARGIKLLWQPNNTVAPEIRLEVEELKLSPKKAMAKLDAELKAELYPHPLFADQSRQIALSFLADIEAEFSPVSMSELRQASARLTRSQITLSPAVNDTSVLWAPKQFELPLLRHQGTWQISYQAGHVAKRREAMEWQKVAKWQVSHQASGALLIRHPMLKQNLRLPYTTDLELGSLPADGSLPANGSSPKKNNLGFVGQWNWQLAGDSSPMAVFAKGQGGSPLGLLPQFSLGMRLTEQALASQLDWQLDMSRISEWQRLPAGTLLNTGELKGRVTTHLPTASLNTVVDIETLFNPLMAEIDADLTHLTGRAKGYEFSGIKLPIKAALKSGRWQLEPQTLTIERIFAGVELTQFAVDLNASGQGIGDDFRLDAELANMTAQTLGGGIALAKLTYPFDKQKAANLKLEHLDLSQLIALGDNQIKVTGQLSGTLPLILSEQGVAIKQGRVASHQGEIVLQENAAWQAMLQQQPTLAGQLRHLNHLYYHLLQGDIQMDEKGQLKAELVIQGENRVEQQPVNLNFSSEQNILTLLKALRLSDQIDKSLSESAQRMYQ